MENGNWLLLTYRVPAEPSSRRVGLWRRLKGLGAIYLQNGVCLLPRTDDHLRRLKILENEIAGMEGDCVLMQAVGLDPAQEQKLISRFQADRDDQYREFLGKCDAFEAEIDKEIRIEKFTYAELEEEDAEFRKLERWLEKIRKLDFHAAPLAGTAQERLTACKARLDDYAKKVFDAHDENR
ncbi:ChrB domain-containing protein [Defluviimonas sp. 20V17]|uniref:PaaX-like protein C-terminal domain-containing protein n=1 Tax=Allgaiera indica TaxID=765699 RepID=A0AAN4USG1_9RHOB|nr:Chromate resistance protein ChrB [Allgaiera indica]KDB02292.1 ChrB domain-containing protein [Defluviimonas sp. 20V17]GHE02802.1 hypothetical protein GCM10008024_23780 [Allgaiera indica]SDX17515.1 PaaX-like protein C-terminal domain-containing protein [Allgaiera indica]